MFDNQLDVQRRLVADRHAELRRVAGRTRLRRDRRSSRGTRRDVTPS